MRPRLPRLVLARPALAASLLAAALLAGCGSDSGSDSEAGASDTPSVAASEDFNGADVAFATDMIPHHAQALVMADMTQGRDLSRETTALVEQIRAAQTPEIEQMSGWLSDWDQPIPETSRDHMNADGHGDDHGSGDSMEGMDGMEDMPGMMSADDMAALEDASDADFEQLWLEMMVEHHEGAIEMAQSEVADGEFADAVALAESISESQQAEIDQMEALLAG